MERQNTAFGILPASTLLIITFITLLYFVHPTPSINAQNDSSTSSVTTVNDSELFTIDPIRQGKFISSGETTTFRVQIHNNGIVSTDIYELDVISSWSVKVFGPDGNIPLRDTNGNGNI